MSDVQLDKKTYDVLKFIYDKKECNMRDLATLCNVHSIEESLSFAAPLLTLFDLFFVAIYNPKINIMDSISLQKYLDACDEKSISHLNPDCIICILPNGSAYVENKEKQEETFADLKRIANSAVKQADLAKQAADSAKKDALFSRILSIIAMLISIATIVVPLFFF